MIRPSRSAAGKPKRRKAPARNDVRSKLPLGPRRRGPQVRPIRRPAGGSYEPGVAKPAKDPWVDEGEPEING